VRRITVHDVGSGSELLGRPRTLEGMSSRSATWPATTWLDEDLGPAAIPRKESGAGPRRRGPL